MAVYQGARRRGFELPHPALDPGAAPLLHSRRRPATAGLVRAGRPTRVGAVLAAIVVAFTLAFLSLSQSVRVAATSYDIVRLASEYERLDARRQDLRSDLNRLGAEPAIRKLGLDNGLGQLDAPLIVPAR
jgi:cell division protein FtsB